jgi:hypothetical protein
MIIFKRHVLAFFFLALGFTQARACDVCGCAMTGTYSGIYPQFTRSIVGLRWRQANFFHPNTDLNLNGSSRVLEDRFQTAEFWGRFYPHPRIQLFAFVPYKINQRTETERTTTISGIGDINLLANYTIVNTGDSANVKLKHTLLVGGGIKLPTGHYQERDENLTMLPAQFQIGTGAYTYTASLNYTIRYEGFGINSDFAYRYSGENERGYQFGAQTSVAINGFYWFQLKGASVLPSAGWSFENYEIDEENGREKPETGGQLQLLNLGCDVYFGNWFAQVSIQQPLLQDIPFAQPDTGTRISFGLARTF